MRKVLFSFSKISKPLNLPLPDSSPIFYSFQTWIQRYKFTLSSIFPFSSRKRSSVDLHHSNETLALALALPRHCVNRLFLSEKFRIIPSCREPQIIIYSREKKSTAGKWSRGFRKSCMLSVLVFLPIKLFVTEEL